MFASMARGSLAYKWARYFGAAARTKVVSTATANHTRTVRPSPLTKLLCSVDTRVALAEFRRGQARWAPEGFDLIFNQFSHFSRMALAGVNIGGASFTVSALMHRGCSAFGFTGQFESTQPTFLLLRPKEADRRMSDIAAERRATPPSKCCLPDPIAVRDLTALRQTLLPAASSLKLPAHRPAPPLSSVHPR